MDIVSYLMGAAAGGGGGSSVTVEPLPVTTNGEYVAPEGKAYSPVTVNVPNSYTESDEGKVVSGGVLVAQTSTSTTQNGTLDTTLYNSVVVNVPQGGGGGVAAKDVNFLDYDGTVVAAYSAADFAALDDLPANPSHDGLTAQGWNWSLADAQSYVASYGNLEIGQMYITDDGKTRLYIDLTDILRNDVPIFFGQSVANGVTVDWGDGSDLETFAGTTNVSVSHVYAATGQYIITLDPADGCTLNLGSTSASAGTCVMGDTGSNFFVYANMLRAVEVGRNVTTIRNHAFQNCRGLRTITLPESVASAGSQPFTKCISLQAIILPKSFAGAWSAYDCTALSHISIPVSATDLDASALYSCRLLQSVAIPDGVTAIGNSALYQCGSLQTITIPSSVTSIAASAFYYCSGLISMKFMSSTPPTVANSNAFVSLLSDCQIYVPAGSLEAYTTATNYPNPSTYTYVEY